MRLSAAALLGLFCAPLSLLSGQSTPVCTGLACQQVTCSGSATTSLTGTVYAPNGTDPLPNVQVYIPNAAVPAFTPGVSCPAVGQAPLGSPLVGAVTAVDGTFTIQNVPVGTNIPLVIVSGRWRRQIVIPSTASCANTAVDPTMSRFPRNQSEGDIPKFAIATGSVDAVECVLRKVGIADTEFTDPSGSGRINLYTGSGGPGASIDSATPAEDVLMGSSATLNSYDVLMLPCEGNAYPQKKTGAEYANLITFANAGGRVYGSHYAYQWMYQNPPFDGVANWAVNQGSYPDGLATVNPNFSASQTLSTWLQDVGASTTPGQIALSQIKHDLNGVIAPTESWLNLNSTGTVMQMVFDTPVGSTGNQCGRVLYNEYHVENPTGGRTFPGECATTATMTAQEKLLEYSLFELTNDGSAATLTPVTQDFGTQPVGFNSPAQAFTFTNNSSFVATVNLVNTSGDFTVTGNNCSSVAANSTCQISVVFKPTAVGLRSGTLTVGSGGTTLTSALTGTGVADLAVNVTSLNFGNLDVGASAVQTVAVTNTASGTVPLPPLAATGDFAVSATTCGSTLGAGATCTFSVKFTPTTTGPRTGTLTPTSTAAAYATSSTALSGNGIDFTLAVAPASGNVIAGYTVSGIATTATPLAGFDSPVSLTCSTTVPGSTCVVAGGNFTLSSATNSAITITTTSKYTVIGYGGMGGPGLLSLAGLGTGLLLWFGRRRVRTVARCGLTLAVFGLAVVSMSGCSGKLPTQNPVYTAPGTYSYTLSATDGFLVHTATYSLTVTVK